MSARALRRGGMAALVCVLVFWGCDDPSGQGSYAGSVQTVDGAPGSALLLMIGEGLVRVEGTGGTLGWSGAVTGSPGEMRVLLIDPDSAGAMTFRLYVEDLSAPTPSFSILQLADRQNLLVEAEGIQLRFER